MASSASSVSSSDERDGADERRIPRLHTHARKVTPFSDEEAKAIAAVRAALGPLHSDDAAFVTDAAIHRYLRARKYNHDKALAMIKATLEWRRSYQPDKIRPDDIAEEAVTGKVYPNGHDRHGRPILILCPGRENTRNPQKQLRHFVFVIERGLLMMPDGVEQLCVVLDFTDFSLLTNPSFTMTMDVLNILTNHYPERLGLAMLYNPHWLFWPSWRLVTPFLDKVTTDKVIFVTAGTEEGDALVDRHFDRRVLERRIGGDFDYEWHFESYWEHVNALPERLPSAPPLLPPVPEADTVTG